MLLTIEKVAVLKSVEIFADIPDFVLASVAAIIEEVDVPAGETFIKEGTWEDCMYIVVEGQIRVHNLGKDILFLGPGKSVGELAVLDPEPRSASATAVADTLLFRINKESFDEVMTDRPEISLGIIRALCRRIRDTGNAITASLAGSSAP